MNQEMGVGMSSLRQALVVAVPSVFLLAGCGDLKLGDNVNVKLDPNLQTASVEVTLSQGVEVGMSGSFPIDGNKGDIYFVAPTQTSNEKIGIQVNLTSFLGNKLNLRSVNALPNGAPFPVAITGPLMSIPVTQSKDVNVSADLSLVPNLQLAAAIGISQLSTKYIPAGIVFCQNFQNADKKDFAAICFYGPSAQSPGGVFLGANFGQVIDPNLLGSSSVQLTASSAAYPVSLSNASASMPVINSPMRANSADYVPSLHDPKNKLQGDTAAKTIRNATRVLKPHHAN